MDFPLVSVIIPTHNRKNKLKRLINSVLSSNYPEERLEIIVVDDASNDGTSEMIRNAFSTHKIKIIRNKENKLVAKSRNIGIKNSTGEYIFFVDDDIVLDEETICRLVKFIQGEQNNSLIGPIIYQYERPERIWSVGVKMNFWVAFGSFIGQDQIDKGQFNSPIECDALPTAFMIHKKIIDKIGYFNADLFPTAFEELDFCIRGKLTGYKVMVLPYAKIRHERSKGSHLDNAKGFYFGTRNRFIAHKLWSRNYFQCIVSKIFSVFFAIAYLIIKSTLFTQNYVLCRNSIFKGLRDGLKKSKKIEPYIYSLKKGKSIKFSENRS